MTTRFPKPLMFLCNQKYHILRTGETSSGTSAAPMRRSDVTRKECYLHYKWRQKAIYNGPAARHVYHSFESDMTYFLSRSGIS